MGSQLSTKALTLELDTLKALHAELKGGEGAPWSAAVFAALQSTATLSPYDESDGDWLQRVSFALRCLTLAPIDVSDGFYQSFLDSFADLLECSAPTLFASAAYARLAAHVAAPGGGRDRLALLNSLVICLAESEIDFEIFSRFEPDEWREELLTYSLFTNYEPDAAVLRRVLDRISDASEHIDSRLFLRDVLDVFVCNSKNTNFNIYFLNDFLFLVNTQPKTLLLAQEMLMGNVSWVQNEISQIKLQMLYDHYSSCAAFDSSELIHLSKYPFDVLLILLTKMPNDFNQLIYFKQLLEFSKINLENEIKLLLKLNPKNSFYEWQRKIEFEIARYIVSFLFSAYEEHSRQKCITQTENVPFASLTTVTCTCFSSSCSFHHTTECCDLLHALNYSLIKIFKCSERPDLAIEFMWSTVAALSKAEQINQLTNALDILGDYEIKLSNSELQQLTSLVDFDNFEREVHNKVVQKSFLGSYEKTIDQLVLEIEALSPGTTTSVVDMVNDVERCYRHASVLLPDEKPISNWSKTQIETWGQVIRCAKNIDAVLKAPDAEMLAVIKRVAEVTLKLQLRNVQLISVILMIQSNSRKGRLCQINTGEGKTLIIAVLAAYHALKGHAVDIYTSSPLLAIPQSREYEIFYTVLNVTVTNNIAYNSNYKCNVIYGTNHTFQRDVLLDEFRKNGVRKSRTFDIAIVDEVDNMLIDGNNWILKLATDMPAMDYLEVLLAAIYIQVNDAAGSLVERGGRTYYLLPESSIDNDGNIKPETSVQEVEIEESKRDFIFNCTETHVRKLIRDTDYCNDIEEGYPEIKIPNHLRKLICKVQLKKWIQNAMKAIFTYVKDEDYVLKDGKIIIVDADNTGALKLNSHWSAGLHQFLELKHGASIQPESFTTNFMSNVGMFTRYVSKLYGLTGTLGSAETRSFLQTTYDVDSIVIPPFKLKQHKSLKPILINNTENKYEEIAKSCIRKLKHGQAVLIIMKYIRETEKQAEVFTKQFNYDTSKLKVVKTDDDTEILEKFLRPGEVIITTNIAGRGTDVKLTKDVEENGGLHICLTFLPSNSRVEHQNIGRTSRNGNRGTSQLVICDPQGCSDIETLKNSRNIQEVKTMAQASETVKKVKNKDRIFRQFCQLLDGITGGDSDTKNAKQTAAEERFAIWLEINEHKLDGKIEDIDKSFEEFKKELLNDDCCNNLIKNPCTRIKLGNSYLLKKQYDKAISEYDTAIILDHNFSEYAYYNRARAYLSQYGHDMEKHEHFINEAVRDLNKARKLIEEKEYGLHLLQTASRGEVLSEQVSRKLNIYNVIKNTIELAIGPDIDAVNEQIKKIENDQCNEDLSAEVKNKMNEMLKNLKEYRNEKGTIRTAKCKNRNIEVSMLEDFMPKSDLKTHETELQEFKLNGWLEGFKVTEIQPINWLSVIGLLALGLGQLLIGAALTVFTLGAGATIGMGLISEGVSDIITAVKDGIINRNFDWSSWALMKVISIAVSVVCAGFKAIKDAVKTAYAGVKTGVAAITQTTKEGWKLVAKRIGLDMAKGVASEIITDLAAYGIDKTILPMIEEIIVEKVREPIEHALCHNKKVATMLKLDLEKGNCNHENKIKDMARNILTPEEYSKLKTIAIAIATRVADKKGFALTRQVITGLVGAYELTTFTTSFINKLMGEIDDFKVETPTDKGHVEQSSETGPTEIVSDAQCDDAHENINGDIDLSKARQTEEQIKLHKNPRTADELSSEIAGMVSKNMIEILKGKIVMPIVQTGVNYTIDKLSSKVTGSLDTQMENYRSKKNIIHQQNKAYAKKTDKKVSKETHSVDEMNKVDRIVNDLKAGGPAGLEHLGAISAVAERPVEVYDELGRLKYTVGDRQPARPVRVQYHEPDAGHVGHFTLTGGREPPRRSRSANMCVFDVVAEQTGHHPHELKNKTLTVMENNRSALAKQVKHIVRLEMYDRSSLIRGGAWYNGKNSKHAYKFLKNSMRYLAFRNKFRAHPDVHVPYRGSTLDVLRAVAAETGRQVELYDAHGRLLRTVGEPVGGAPIQLTHHRPGDDYSEWFTAVGGGERYRFRDPDDENFFRVVGEQAGRDPAALRAATARRMRDAPVPPGEHCIENESAARDARSGDSRPPMTGFVSLDEQAYVLDHALRSPSAQRAMDELNRYRPGAATAQRRQEVRVPAGELRLPRPARGGSWRRGELRETWLVGDVFLLLQHYRGPKQSPDAHARNPRARVHVQTVYPYPPPTDPPPAPPAPPS